LSSFVSVVVGADTLEIGIPGEEATGLVEKGRGRWGMDSGGCYTFGMAPQVFIDPDQLREFCRRWQVKELSLFGSVLREDFRLDSDVDVLVGFAPEAPWSLWDLSAMRSELEGMLGRKVDLVEKRGLRNPFLRHAVLTNRRVLYAA
jgi:predicted nucleotidyltransferase